MADHGGTVPGPGYALPEIFDALRADLIAARQKLLDANQEPIMELIGTEVELTFTLEHSGKGKAGVNLKVLGVGFEAGGEKGIARSAVHRLKVTLGPIGIVGVAGEVE
ncbi:hypothetical protein GCM10022419_045500 [Nonomuraea rosea]|uniref:Trypsin-co-occurring domain-containing protein n=1 Tax=Nonomuraea rosea TaxID=638574 RepID=A0ABP6X2J7_9ACTN